MKYLSYRRWIWRFYWTKSFGFLENAFCLEFFFIIFQKIFLSRFCNKHRNISMLMSTCQVQLSNPKPQFSSPFFQSILPAHSSSPIFLWNACIASVDKRNFHHRVDLDAKHATTRGKPLTDRVQSTSTALTVSPFCCLEIPWWNGYKSGTMPP